MPAMRLPLPASQESGWAVQFQDVASFRLAPHPVNSETGTQM